MKKQFGYLLVPLALIVLGRCANEAYATGALFSRPRWSEQRYIKMWIKSQNVNVDIQQQIAVTHCSKVQA